MSKNEVELKANQKVSRSGMLIFLMLLISISLLLAFMYTAEKSASLKTDNQILTRIMYYNFQYTEETSSKNLLAESYYEEATLDYERKDFLGAETNCKIAREYYSDVTQSIRNLKAELLTYNEEENKYSNLIDIYASMMEQDIKTQENLYEACEYLESASRAYASEDYLSGDASIEKMNEKIRIHDEAVRAYNDKLGELKSEVKNLWQKI